MGKHLNKFSMPKYFLNFIKSNSKIHGISSITLGNRKKFEKFINTHKNAYFFGNEENYKYEYTAFIGEKIHLKKNEQKMCVLEKFTDKTYWIRCNKLGYIHFNKKYNLRYHLNFPLTVYYIDQNGFN